VGILNATAADVEAFSNNFDGVAKSKAMAMIGLCRVAIFPDYGVGSPAIPGAPLKAALLNDL
jgi:hypothetical protein